jgi:hypothetical protein
MLRQRHQIYEKLALQIVHAMSPSAAYVRKNQLRKSAKEFIEISGKYEAVLTYIVAVLACVNDP